MTPAQWEALGIPVNLAFLFHQTDQDRYVAFYPSPGGATESLLDLASWDEVVAGDPLLRRAGPGRRGRAAAPARRRRSSATWCRSTRATSWSASSASTGKASPAARRSGGGSTRSSPGSRSAAVVDLDFTCTGADADRYAATPTILLHLRITETTGTPVHALALRCQIRIEPIRRRYNDEEAEGLADLFGDRSRWGETLKPLQLAFVTQMVPGLHRLDRRRPPPAVQLRLRRRRAQVPVRGARRRRAAVAAVQRDDLHRRPGHRSVTPVAWQKETTYSLPVAVWRDAMDQHFPGAAWLQAAAGDLRQALPLPGAGGAAGLGRRDRAAAEGDSWNEPSVRRRPAGRGRAAVRGLRALPVPGLGREEPGPLAVRRTDAAGLRALDPSERSWSQTECLLDGDGAD